MKRALVLAALAACGDNQLVADAPPIDAAIRCSAAFHGNFDATATVDTCATATVDTTGHATIALTIPTTALDDPWTAELDLGVMPTPGRFTSGGAASWSASGVKRIGNGVCFYDAGATVVPTGSYALALATIDVATHEVHGTLALVQYVLAYPGTDCGDGDTETIDVTF